MRIVFCGSGDVAVPTLRALRDAGHDVPAAVTQPPRPAGRGGRLTPTPVALQCGEWDLPVIDAPSINAPEVVDRLRRLEPRLIVVVDFGQKIHAAARGVAPLGAINMHASLLPKLRGAAPVNWALIRGDTVTGVTTFHLVDRMDAGPILLQRSTPIAATETAEDLRARLAQLGAVAVLETVEGLAAGRLAGVEQDEAAATLAPKLDKACVVIDFADSACELSARIRGTWPWPGAHADFRHAGRPDTRVILARCAALPPSDRPGEPGALADDLTVHTGDGRLEILELKVAGKRLMHWRDFVNGYRVAPGDRFLGTPKTQDA